MDCKVCEAETRPFGALDFNRSCEDAKGLKTPPSGVLVSYVRCVDCGLIFTGDFDDWSPETFSERIYNADYPTFDPDFSEVRPSASAAFVAGLLDRARDTRILDYGGGDGRMAALLTARGFGNAGSYDPIYSPQMAADGPYDVITCFETLEHVPDPHRTLLDITRRLADPGVVIFTTMLQQPNIADVGVDWWYIGPRNGHITIYSPDALYRAWALRGFTCLSLSQGLHIAFKNCPTFAEKLAADGARFQYRP